MARFGVYKLKRGGALVVDCQADLLRDWVFMDELTGVCNRRYFDERLACEWARAEFEAMGVPKVELEKWATWPVVWNRGQWMGRVVAPEQVRLAGSLTDAVRFVAEWRAAH